MPWLWIPPRGKLEKRLHFHRAVEMEQAHIVTAPKLFGRAANGALPLMNTNRTAVQPG